MSSSLRNYLRVYKLNMVLVHYESLLRSGLSQWSTEGFLHVSMNAQIISSTLFPRSEYFENACPLLPYGMIVEPSLFTHAAVGGLGY